MSDLKFRKFETFDLKQGDTYIPSTEQNNYNNTAGEKEDFLVGYHTGTTNTVSGKNEFKILLQDARGIYYGTTEYWSKNPCVPKQGDIYIYVDAVITGPNGEQITTPQVKVGTGNAWLDNLRFITQPTAELLQQHMADNERHVNPGEREYWNNKINIDPDNAVENETLLINRKNL